MGDPQVTMGFTTKSWSFMTWMMTGVPPYGGLQWLMLGKSWELLGFHGINW